MNYSDNIFYHPSISKDAKQFELLEQESKHCIKVLRMVNGDKLTVTDGKGNMYNCVIINNNYKQCLLEIEEKINVSKTWNFNLTIAFAPTKNMDRNEWFVEKATEIGIDNFVILKTDLSERKDIKIDRLSKTAISAMKQSKQSILPSIKDTINFKDFVSNNIEGRKFIAHCHNTDKLKIQSSYKSGQDATILIGPEGDFSLKEIELAIKNGFEPITLSKNRLRTETACLFACDIIHTINNIKS